jgi:DNA polymerase-3 subunit beta
MFAVAKSELSPALAMIRAGLKKTSDIAAHSHVLMQLQDGKLRLVTDCVSLHAETSLSVKGPNVAVVVPSEIADIVDRLDGLINFEASESKLTIKAGRTRVNLQLMDVSCFAEISKDTDIHTSEVAASDLIRCFTLVDPAVARKHNHQHLTGVLLEWDKHRLTVVGTDGFMMSVSLMATNADWCGSCVVPLKTTVELTRLIKAIGAKLVKIEKGPNTVTFVIGQCEITSKLIGGTFPDWKQLTGGLSKIDPVTTIEVTRDNLLEAMQRLMLVARDEKRLMLQYENDKLTLSIANKNQSAEEPIQVTCTQKGNILLNKEQVATTIARLAGDTLTFHIWDNNKPIRLFGKSRAEFYLITPMRE